MENNLEYVVALARDKIGLEGVQQMQGRKLTGVGSAGYNQQWRRAVCQLYQCIMMARTLTSITLMYRFMKVFGDALLLAKCPLQAAEVFEMMRAVAEEMKDTDMMIEAYSSIGVANQQAERYGVAEQAYKCLLVIAWNSKSEKVEIDAYYGLAL